MESDAGLDKEAAVRLEASKLSAGSRIVRGCTSKDHPTDSSGLHMPRLFFPVSILWPALAARMQPGKRLFPMLA